MVAKYEKDLVQFTYIGPDIALVIFPHLLNILESNIIFSKD